jgi:hypothetical protein
MSREVVCPQCGMRLPIDPRDEPPPAGPSLDAGHTIETVIPQTVSADDLGPIPHIPHHPTEIALPHPAGAGSGTSANGHSHEHGSRAGYLGESSYWPSADLDGDETLAEGGADLAEPRPAFPAIQLDRPSEPAPAPAAETRPPDDEFLLPEHRGPSWLVVLLGSYASAMTLACAWLWWRAGPSPPSPESDPIAASGRPDTEAGQREARSEIVAPPPEIAPGRTTVLGQSLTVGALEFTPLEVRVGRVELEHRGLDGSYEMRDGGDGALFLRVRFRNLSRDEVFAPLDEAFVREPDRGLPDSFLESPSGERIYLYPLPLASEWSIVEQDFRAIRPGETFDTVLVSDERALSRVVGPMTWRLRLRTGADAGRTELVGVRIDRGQIR